MNISNDYVSLIPPPKPKKEAKKKAEKVDKPAKEAEVPKLEYILSVQLKAMSDPE